MTTRISKIADDGNERTMLRVEGSLHVEDAEVLERTYTALDAEQSRNVAIDLSGISFLDSESAGSKGAAGLNRSIRRSLAIVRRRFKTWARGYRAMKIFTTKDRI